MAKILVVDDDESLLKMLLVHLRQEGHEVHGASTGDDGLARASKERFDLVITDKNLPGHDGLELVHLARKHTYAMPVILITGHGAEGAQRTAEELGAFYLEKPFDLQALRAQVELALSQARSGARTRERIAAKAQA